MSNYRFALDIQLLNKKLISSYKHFEEYDQTITGNLNENSRQILTGIGKNVTREGILKTFKRAAKAIQFLTFVHCQDPEEILKRAMFTESYRDMVIIIDIELCSLCEHHILPFFGRYEAIQTRNEFLKLISSNLS